MTGCVTREPRGIGPDDWTSVERLFHEVADVPTGEREVALAAVETNVREQVRSLLAADSQGGQSVMAAVEEGHDLLLPQRFGPYRVTGLAGRGGMGAVFQAVRDDGAFARQVAIKVMHTGLDVHRFKQERAILAALEHPHIARLLDGGETETGASYIVLEYVDGVPLLDYCHREQLPTNARLRLFLDICSAVQHAHQHLIVHRDLKPGNILVTSDGTPKLLDFGIAKLVNTEPGRTATALQALTPHYASPEQVRGDAITTASDVYSLGVILYELLTGRRPYDFESLTAAEIERTVCNIEPAAPGLPADLDNITLKALRKDPARRYASVQQLADDIQRFLSHRPVTARPDTFAYRAAKFFRRNWHRAGAAALAVSTILVGSGVAVYEAHVARQRFDDVRRLANRFLFDFESQVRDLPGATKAREMVVATAIEYLNRLAKDAGDDPDLLDEIAQGYQKAAKVLWQPGFHGLGRANDALATLEKPRGMYEQLLRRSPGNERFGRQLAITELLIGDLQNETRRYQDAQASATRVLALLEPLLRRQPADEELQRLQVRAWRAQGLALSLSGQSGVALGPLRRAASALESFAGQNDDPQLHHDLLSLLTNLGDALERRGHLAEALDAYERCIAEARQLLARNPNSASVTRLLLISYRRKSGVLGNPDRPNLGRLQEAVTAAAQSLEIAKRLFDSDPNDALAAHDYAIAQGKIADLVGEIDPHRALELNRRAIAIVRNGAMGDYRERLSIAYPLSVAPPLRVLGRNVEAFAGLIEAEKTARKLLAAVPEDVDLKMDLAAIYREMGDIEIGLRHWAQATTAYERSRLVLETMAKAKPDFIRLQYQLAAIYERLAATAVAVPGEELRWTRELVSLWQRWVSRSPDSPFGCERLRDAQRRLDAAASLKTRDPRRRRVTEKNPLVREHFSRSISPC